MTTAALIISMLALSVSAGTLTWQVVNYLLTGQRASLDVTAMNVFAPKDGARLEPIIQITVRAIGRVPVEVTGWSVGYPNHVHLHSALVEQQYSSLPGVFLGDPIPKVIEPGRSGSFNLPRVAVEKAAEIHGLDPEDGHVEVYFAARRRLRDRKSVGERTLVAHERRAASGDSP